MVGMVERAEGIGGRLEIASAPGQGTVVRAIVPFSRQIVSFLS
jgi:signal transduction histidine kinase